MIAERMVRLTRLKVTMLCFLFLFFIFSFSIFHYPYKTLRARGDAADSPSVVPVAVVRTWVDVRAEEVQVVGVVGRVSRRRPVVAVQAATVHRAAVDVAGIDKINWVFAPT